MTVVDAANRLAAGGKNKKPRDAGLFIN